MAQIDRARQAAREQLQAALDQKPKLLLHVSLDAPKVAIPVAASSTGEGTSHLSPPAYSCISDHLGSRLALIGRGRLQPCGRPESLDITDCPMLGWASRTAFAWLAGMSMQLNVAAMEAACCLPCMPASMQLGCLAVLWLWLAQVAQFVERGNVPAES